MNILLLLSILLSGILVVCRSKHEDVQSSALAASLCCFFFSTILFTNFDSYSSFQHLFIANWISEYGITFCLGVDGLSLFFVLLTTFLTPLILLSTAEVIKADSKIFYTSVLFVEFFLILAFSSLDIFLFYFSFEAILLPMILIITLWGKKTRRIKAVFYFFFFTFVGSFFMLLSILYLNAKLGTTNYLEIYYSSEWLFSRREELLLWMGFFVAFAVKVPMYPFHIWLPEAHVEAPTSGSMILAGLLLKLGGYGFLRFSIGLFPFASAYYFTFIYVLASVSIVYSVCCALIQIDIKRLIAYSSIAHMNMAVMGIFSGYYAGFWGGYVMMLGHGLVSPALFFLIGCVYDRYHERTVDYYGGVAQTSPVLAFFMFYFVTSNFGFPWNVNFFAEVMIIVSVYKSNFFSLMILLFASVMSIVYSIFFYQKVFSGTINNAYVATYMDISKREIAVILPLSLWGLFFFFQPGLISDSFGYSFYQYLVYPNDEPYSFFL